MTSDRRARAQFASEEEAQAHCVRHHEIGEVRFEVQQSLRK